MYPQFSYWRNDLPCWDTHPATECPFKTIYNPLAQPQMGPYWTWKRIRTLQATPRLRLFAWRSLQDRLPIAYNLHNMNTIQSPKCLLCHSHQETVDHLFYQCQITNLFWNLFPNSITKPTLTNSFAKWFESICTSSSCYHSQLVHLEDEE